MSIQEVSAEQFAELFHHYHEALAPDFNYPTESQADSWREMPPTQRSRMIAAARLALLDIAYSGERHKKTNGAERYFANPGEAEWGC
jgi:hypothetical protein